MLGLATHHEPTGSVVSELNKALKIALANRSSVESMKGGRRGLASMQRQCAAVPHEFTLLQLQPFFRVGRFKGIVMLHGSSPRCELKQSWEAGCARLIPLTQVRLYVVGLRNFSFC
jgi:hypothetical protein